MSKLTMRQDPKSDDMQILIDDFDITPHVMLEPVATLRLDNFSGLVTPRLTLTLAADVLDIDLPAEVLATIQQDPAEDTAEADRPSPPLPG